jgi:hypothetical protein
MATVKTVAPDVSAVKAAAAEFPTTEASAHLNARAAEMSASAEVGTTTHVATTTAESTSHMAAATTTSHVATAPAASTAAACKCICGHSASQNRTGSHYDHDLAQHFIYSFGRSRPFNET